MSGFVSASDAFTERAARGLFQRGFLKQQVKSVYTEFTTVTDTFRKSEIYPIVGRINRMKLGSPGTYEGRQEFSYTVENKEYNLYEEHPREAFEYDQIGWTKTIFSDMGKEASENPQRLAFKVLANGSLTSGVGYQAGYDTKPLFSTTHTLDGGTTSQANQKTFVGAGDAIVFATDDWTTIVEKLQAQLNNAITSMENFVDSHGNPWLPVSSDAQFTVCCAPELRLAFQAVLKGDLVATTTNTLRSSIKRIISSAYLNSDDQGNATKKNWYLTTDAMPMKAVFNQRWRPIRPGEVEDPLGAAGGAAYGPSLSSVDLQAIVRTGKDISHATMTTGQFFFNARQLTAVVPGFWQAAFKTIAGVEV